MELSRRDFLKVAGAGAAAAAASVPLMPAPAAAYTLKGGDTAVSTYHTTCPYCSASCGQLVDVGNVTGDVYDVYGDYMSPYNMGGLCAKGAGGFQLATNSRRLGAWASSHPVDPAFTYDSAYADGIAYKRTGNLAWSKMPLTGAGGALEEIAAKLVTARAVDGTGWVPGSDKYSSKSVAFFGSSHMNNEQNYLYRRIIANFGTQNTEHQARI